jgi:hypothetical protein
MSVIARDFGLNGADLAVCIDWPTTPPAFFFEVKRRDKVTMPI